MCLPTVTHSGPHLFDRHHFNVEGDITRRFATSPGVNNRFKIYSSFVGSFRIIPHAAWDGGLWAAWLVDGEYGRLTWGL